MAKEVTKVDVAKVMAANIERLVETIQGKIKKNGGSLEEQLFRHYQRCLLYLDAFGKTIGKPKWMLAFKLVAKAVHEDCPELKAQYDSIIAEVNAMREKAAKETADAAKAKEDAKVAKKAEKEKAKTEAKTKVKVAKEAAKKAKAEAKVKEKAAKKVTKPAKKAANPGKSTKKAKKKSANKAKAKS